MTKAKLIAISGALLLSFTLQTDHRTRFILFGHKTDPFLPYGRKITG